MLAGGEAQREQLLQLGTWVGAAATEDARYGGGGGGGSVEARDAGAQLLVVG